MFDGLSPELSKLVMKGGFIDYVALTGIAKNKDSKLAEEAGRLLQEAITGGHKTEPFFGDVYINVSQEFPDGKKMNTLFTVREDDVLSSITHTEYDVQGNQILVQKDRNADGNPDEIYENEYYYLDDSSKIKKRVTIFDDNSDGKPDNGYVEEMDIKGNITKSEPLDFSN